MSKLIVDNKNKLSKADYAKLRKLSNDPNFLFWQGLIEDFIIQTAINLMAGNGVPQGVKNTADYMRGRYDMYKKIVRPLEDADEIIKTFNNDNKGNTEESGE